MAWKQSGHPTVQQQRDKWVVRVEGVDTETGRRRPKQVGTYTSRRAAQAAAAAFTASGAVVTERETVGRLVDEWVAGKVDVSTKTRMQYEWAAGHIPAGIGGLRVDRLDRSDVAGWFDQLAADGKFSRRSIQIMRMVLRAALADADEVGELRRSPAARVGMPRNVARSSSSTRTSGDAGPRSYGTEATTCTPSSTKGSRVRTMWTCSPRRLPRTARSSHWISTSPTRFDSRLTRQRASPSCAPVTEPAAANWTASRRR